MKCTATTRLTAEQCLARLAECPALPRGERLQWATPSSNLWNRAMRHRSQWYGSMLRPVLWSFAVTAGSTVSQEALDVCWARWRTIAAPVRRLREERRALREALAEVLGPASPPPVSSDVVKNMLNQIEAFSTAMRRTWGEP